MKKIALACLAALALLSGTGCEKIIEFKGEQTEPRLTVSAQAEVGKPLEAFLASSISSSPTPGTGRLSSRSSIPQRDGYAAM